MDSKEELHRCKQLLLVQLGAMEDMLKSIKELSAIGSFNIDTSRVEKDIVDLYEGIEEHKPK